MDRKIDKIDLLFTAFLIVCCAAIGIYGIILMVHSDGQVSSFENCTVYDDTSYTKSNQSCWDTIIIQNWVDQCNLAFGEGNWKVTERISENPSIVINNRTVTCTGV